VVSVLSALMLHHLDHDTKAEAAAEVFRVLRPGGSLHLADFTGQMHGIHGLLAQRGVRSGHLVGNLDEGIPRLLAAAGLDCADDRQAAAGRRRADPVPADPGRGQGPRA
jgi:hypothetical protein